MASVDFGRYKRLVQALWDPEPRNDDISGACIWCLGKRYTTQTVLNGTKDPPPAAHHEDSPFSGEGDQDENHGDSAVNSAPQREQQAPEVEVDRGWPPDFLDDCESRIWFTYRSNFPAIKKSSDASMTLSVRLRSLGDQGAFTSDTGWGCMIRSGQSLLANALVTLRLGRGVFIIRKLKLKLLTAEQIGVEEQGKKKNGSFYLYLRMTRVPRFRYIAL